MEELQALSSSLRDSEYFKDLEDGTLPPQTAASRSPNIVSVNKTHQYAGLPVSVNTDTPIVLQPAQTSLATHSPQVKAPSFPSYNQPAKETPCSFVVTQFTPELLPHCVIQNCDSVDPAVGLSLTINVNGLMGSMDTANKETGLEGTKDETTMDLDGEPDLDSFPILVRSMSTSRRHSWGVPVSPINLDRR